MANKIHIKKGDTVEVIAGSDKGSKGKVLVVMPSKNKALVERLNMVKRHQRPSQKYPTGGIIEKEAPIDISNLRLISPIDGKPTKAKQNKLENGKTMRKCARTGEVFE